MLAAFLLSFSTFEHFIYLSAEFTEQYMEDRRCGWAKNDVLKVYAMRNYGYVFHLPWMPFNLPVLLYLRFIHYSITLAWTYQDVTIVIMSSYLTMRFGQLFARVEAARTLRLPSSFWQEIREHHVILCELLNRTNHMISPLLLSSCFNNVALISYFALHSLKTQHFVISYVYFWCCVGFLVGRTSLVLLTAGEVHRTMERAVLTLHRTPSEGWCSELERYDVQLRSEESTLGGLKMFEVTRRTAFTIASLIFTLELIVIKFSRQAGANTGVPANCSQLAFSQD
ncbi:gustatory receptor for sugar taste 64a-like [Uranotaenia lowii]|uniref:gustatory receptor for sugar taste 64a-like n=1 Tax=Uranotaenia lowii TaxID=190385 RepID=UPI002478C312|nr:gustatory receptor for sugar taste 64a-like [Uranotaenia lowii]